MFNTQSYSSFSRSTDSNFHLIMATETSDVVSYIGTFDENNLTDFKTQKLVPQSDLDYKVIYKCLIK